MIRMENVSQWHGKQAIFEAVDLQIGQGEVCVLVGSNGIGKSTLLQTMLGLLPGYRGTIRVMGRDIRQSGEWKRGVFYLPEHFRLYPTLTVYENAAFFAALEKADEARIREALERTGMLAHRAQKAGALSKGMLQRLGLSLAFLGEAELLVLDEPTSGLDPAGQEEVLTIVESLKTEGKTVVFSSHYRHEIEQVGTHVVVVREQGIRKVAATEYLHTDPFVKQS